MGAQLSLLVNRAFYADGESYQPKADKARLSTQLELVREVMSDGRKHTLAELVGKVGGSEGGVSARLRDLRKPRFGGHDIRRERVPGVPGLWRYWLAVAP